MSTSLPLVVADRYRLVAPLGQGGMGRVWRATDVVLHREVAIKELVPPPGLTPDERREMRERSLREARAIARLNNINVVRIFDVLRTDADPWIVMEYVPSRSLQDTLAAGGPFPPVRTAEIGLGVLNALRAAHRAGVVHRDVKPGNVLIGADGRVVLTDFGLATVPGDPTVTRTGLVLGSPAYIAPERARDGTAGPGADLWSLGATLYAAVEGTSPFARPTAIATLAALATENPPPARNAGPLKPVLNGLLRKDPSHRINAEEAERLLLRATGRRSKLSFPMSPTMRRPGVGRERPALPGTPPAAPGAAAAAGSAPVVPGPRPPVTPARPGPSTRGPDQPGHNQPEINPSGINPSGVNPSGVNPSGVNPSGVNPSGVNPPVGPAARAGADDRPVYAPGKASVGRPARPSDTPTRIDVPKIETPEIETTALDATRIDTPPVRDRGRPPHNQDQPISGTATPAPNLAGPASPPAPAAAPTSAQGALAKGTRGAFGMISAAEIAAHRQRTRPPAPDHPTPEAPTAEDPRTTSAPVTSAPSAGSAAGDTAAPGKAAPAGGLAGSATAASSVPSVEADLAVPGSASAAEAGTAGGADGSADTAATDSVAAGSAALANTADSVAPGSAVPAGTTPTGVGSAEGAGENGAGNESAASAGTPQGSLCAGAAGASATGPRSDRHSAGADVSQSAAAADERVGTRAGGGSTDQPVAGDVAGSTQREGSPTDRDASSSRGADGSRFEEAPSAAASATGDMSETSVGSMAAESPSHSGVAGRAGGAPADGSAGGDVDDGATDRSPLAAGKPAAARTSAAGKLDAGPAAADSVVSANDAEVGEADNGAGFGGDNGGGFAKAGTDAPATGDESAATAGASDAQAETGAGTTAASATKPTVGARAGAGSTSRAARKKGKSRISARTDPAAPAGPPSAAAQASADGTDDEPATEPGATTGEGEGPAAAVTELPAAGSRSKVPAARSADRTVITASVDSARSADADAATDADADAATGADAAAGGAVVGVPLARQPEGTEQLSSFVGSGRPAWTPMPVQPRHFGDKGVTVLGTTLTRRQTGIALAIVLALIVGLVLIVVNVFGSGGDKKGSTTARPVATAKGTKPAAVVPTPSQRTTAAASAPATSAPVSSAPADTGWAVTLPAGWSMYRDPTGFSVPVPAGVSISHQGSEVYFRKDYRLLIVDQTDQPQPDPVADWKRQEADRSGTYQDYQRIAIVPVDYFLKAADWEFTYTTSSGNPQHVVKRGLIAGPHQAYGISWFTSPADWAAGQKDLQLIYQGFQPRR